MFRFVDPDNTRETRIPDEDGAPTFTLGFWPPRESDRLQVAIARMSKMGDADPVADMNEAVKRSGIALDTFMDMVRYGCRGWSGIAFQSGTVEVEIHGRKHKALDQRSLDALYANRLLVAVALECMRFNALTDEEKKRSG